MDAAVTPFVLPTIAVAGVDHRWRPPAGAGPTLATIAILALLLAAGVGGGAIGWARELDASLAGLGAFWLIGTALRRVATARAIERIGAGLELAAAFFGLAILAALVAALFATSARPYADAWLAGIDRALFPGFDWPATMLALGRQRAAMLVLTHAYGALQWEPLLLLALFCATGRDARGWRLLAGWSGALLVCLAVFPWLPGRGAYPFFGIAPGRVPGVGLSIAWSAPLLLDGLRDGSVAMLGNATMDGIITMPSFHAAGAVVLGCAGWRAGRLRWPLTALNAAMLVSAVPVGGHYLVDVIAGVAVGIGAAAIAGMGARQR